jgi:hypothetical protein
LRGHGRALELHSETVSSSLQACLGGIQPPGVYSVIRLPVSTACQLVRGTCGPVHYPRRHTGRRLGEAGASLLPNSLLCGFSLPQRLLVFHAAGAAYISTHQLVTIYACGHTTAADRIRRLFNATSCRRCDYRERTYSSHATVTDPAERAGAPVL